MFDFLKNRHKNTDDKDGKTVCQEHYQEIILKQSQEPSDVGIQLHQIMCEYCLAESIMRPAIGIITIKQRND